MESPEEDDEAAAVASRLPEALRRPASRFHKRSAARGDGAAAEEAECAGRRLAGLRQEGAPPPASLSSSSSSSSAGSDEAATPPAAAPPRRHARPTKASPLPPRRRRRPPPPPPPPRCAPRRPPPGDDDDDDEEDDEGGEEDGEGEGGGLEDDDDEEEGGGGGADDEGEGGGVFPEARRRARGAGLTGGPGCGSAASASSASRGYEVVRELGPEEVRWFYREERKSWKPFIGYDSLRIELAFRALLPLLLLDEAPAPATGGSPERPAGPEPVCVRGGLYEVDVANAECYPVYWNPTEKIPVMRGQWFIDGTWQPLEEDESNLIEQEHLSCFKGQQMQENFDMELLKPVDGKEGGARPLLPDPSLPSVAYHLPPFSLHSLFKWRGYNENAEAPGLKRKRSEAVHSLKLSRTHVDWHSVDEVYLYSDATTSKIARTVTQKLGFSKASSSGTRLHRGYVEEATLEDKPSPTTHIVFVVHGIGQKMDQGRIIKNTAMMRDTARKIEDKYFSNHATHVEFLPVEWRSKLTLDGDTVDSITPDKVRGLRDMLNSSAMDIMYYTSPLYRDELVKGLQQELNRLYTLFCSRNPDFRAKGGKVSIVSHSLGCVITYDIMTGWNPVRLYEQLLEKEYEDLEDTWMSYEEQHLLEEFYLTKQRLKEIEERLHGLRTSTISKPPALKFKVENFFCMGSPLAVFLALRGIRPGNSGSQDHILPRTLCNRLLNIFHPTDPVAYRLEPLILKHYSNISPVQIHWYNTTNPLPYEHMKPSFLNPTKEPTSVSESESVPTIPSPTTSPVLARRHYGESITNIGKASILGAASIGKGLGGMLFSRFGRSSVPASQALEPGKEGAEAEEKKPTSSQASIGTQTFPHSSSGFLDPTLELEHRIDFELREGLVESRYWSAVTSHTAYWSSMDIALFLLTFMYKQDQGEEDGIRSQPDPV
ncbi:phospholipase DDHD1 isoform X3 [Paroedura picta]|uniref:phospholipase DDHD1 isoform X3 n=1 Tax=Paroedura picta TaxID=143630 RepID=UPI0040572753